MGYVECPVCGANLRASLKDTELSPTGSVCSNCMNPICSVCGEGEIGEDGKCTECGEDYTLYIKKDRDYGKDIQEYQDAIDSLYKQIDEIRDKIWKTVQDEHVAMESPIPFCVDRKGIIHAPGPFNHNINETVDEIMENITEDKNLCIIREALGFYFGENGLPEND